MLKFRFPNRRVLTLHLVLLTLFGGTLWYVLTVVWSPSRISSRSVTKTQLYDTFKGCEHKADAGKTYDTFHDTITTVEGDPIVTDAKVVGYADGCHMDIVSDASQDEWSGGGASSIGYFSCRVVYWQGDKLTAATCIDTKGHTNLEGTTISF